jgi:hypothetical protein
VFCKSDDQITHTKSLSPGNKLISKSGDFALGFFSTTNSNGSLYLGIWYDNIPKRTVVWVANRDSPIAAPSSTIITITNTSDLVLTDSNGLTFWLSKNNITSGATGVAAVLLVTKAIGNNEERKRNHSTETQDFNVENPLQQREVKTTGASQQNFTISGVCLQTPWTIL